MILPSGKQACEPNIATVAPLTVGRARRAFNMSLAWALKGMGTVVSPRKVRVNVPSVALQVTCDINIKRIRIRIRIRIWIRIVINK